MQGWKERTAKLPHPTHKIWTWARGAGANLIPVTKISMSRVEAKSCMLPTDSGEPWKGFRETMAKRKISRPETIKEGQFWWLRVWDIYEY